MEGKGLGPIIVLAKVRQRTASLVRGQVQYRYVTHTTTLVVVVVEVVR
jgi:hypothetical protein